MISGEFMKELPEDVRERLIQYGDYLDKKIEGHIFSGYIEWSSELMEAERAVRNSYRGIRGELYRLFPEIEPEG